MVNQYYTHGVLSHAIHTGIIGSGQVNGAATEHPVAFNQISKETEVFSVSLFAITVPTPLTGYLSRFHWKDCRRYLLYVYSQNNLCG